MALSLVPLMSNEELSAAIDRTRKLLGQTGTGSTYFKPLDDHLKTLLWAEAYRATHFDMKEIPDVPMR